MSADTHNEFCDDPIINTDPSQNENIVSFDTSDNVILATGGFGLSITFPEVAFLDEKLSIISTFDTTNTIRISFDVRLFNEKINLYKNADNTTILDTSFNSTTGRFPAVNIQVEFNEFKNNITPDRILSLGSFTNIYKDFSFQVKKYFHFPLDSKLFTTSSISELNQNTFDTTEFIRTLDDTITDVSGNEVSAFSGFFSLSGINPMLTDLVANDTFSNRSLNNYTVEDGFIAGDKILVVPGITFDMGVVLANPYSLNVQELSLLAEQCYHTNETPSKFLQKQYRAPILLELNNLS